MNPVSCDDLDRYLDGTLAEPQRRGFENHLQSCVHCQRELHVQQQIDSLLAESLRIDLVPQTLIDTIERRIIAASRRRRSWAIGAAAAAALVLAIGGWIGWQRMPGREGPPIVDRRPTDPDRSVPADDPSREEPVPIAATRVSVGPTADGIVVPLESGDAKVAIFWFYPSVPATRKALQN